MNYGNKFSAAYASYRGKNNIVGTEFHISESNIVASQYTILN